MLSHNFIQISFPLNLSYHDSLLLCPHLCVEVVAEHSCHPEGVAEGDGVALGVLLGVPLGVADGVKLGVADTVAEGVAEGLGVADGV